MEKRIKEAAAVLACSSKTVVLTGAGISKESGIATFRDPGGLWRERRPEEIATLEAFRDDPQMVWSWYSERLLKAGEKEPNSGHYALADLEKILPGFLVITQNVDNLHGRSGIRNLVELHGNIERFKCSDLSHPVDYDPAWGADVPTCHCGSLIRPDVVWFGEALPEAELELAFSESAGCETFMIVGTSGLVVPAASLPVIAKNSGAFLIEVNPNRSALTAITDIFLQGPSGILLPQLYNAVSNIIT
jgi:NAD-dependent deacetylase